MEEEKKEQQLPRSAELSDNMNIQSSTPQQNEDMVTPGNEYPQDQEPQQFLSPEKVAEWKQTYPNSKMGFFIHVNDPYVYRSFSTLDAREFNMKIKDVETKNGTKLTDDQYLDIFLDAYVLVPEKMSEKIAKGEVAAGIPHLLYDLINHISGFADVEPLIL